MNTQSQPKFNSMQEYVAYLIEEAKKRNATSALKNRL